MGLLDGPLGGLLTNLLGKDPGSLGAKLNDALANTQYGNLQGVLTQLQGSGLGQQVSSWLGSGANLPVSSEQLRAALGDEHLQKIAASLGIPVDQVSSVLAQFLPTVVDKLSPDGTLNPPPPAPPAA